MKFGFIVTNLAGGGAEKAIVKLAGGLAGRGHAVHLILLEAHLEHAPPAGCALHVATPGRRPCGKGWLGKRVAAWRLRRLVRQLAADGPFDLLVSTLPFSDEVALRARLPRLWCRIANTLSAEVAALQASNPAKAARRLARYRRVYGRARLIAVSDGVADDLRCGIGLADARIERIYNPFDFAAIRAAAQEPAGLPSRPYIVHVGRFARQKRHDLLLDAYRLAGLAHGLVLLTAADPRLQRLIDERGLAGRVVVAGFQANPYPWIAGADLLVLCSDHEGLPNVLIEALACGTRAVSTDCPSGPREILGGALAASLVPCNYAAALAGAMRAALAAPAPPADAALAPFAKANVIDAYERLATAA